MVRRILVSVSLILFLTVAAEAAILFEDQFSGDSLARPPWTVLHENNPGGVNFWVAGNALHTKTLQGDFRAGYTGYKNFFVIPNIWGRQNFAVTIRVLDFKPYRQYQQIAILAYDGDNDYVKVVNDYWGTGQHWEIAKEAGGVFENKAYDPDANNSAFYLRMMKRGNAYTAYYSLDGLTYHKFGGNGYTFGDGSPAYLGFCAFQGEYETQAPVTLQVDYFRVESLAGPAPITLLLLE
jgi:hypothetical protein